MVLKNLFSAIQRLEMELDVRGGLTRRETGRFSGGPLLREVYLAPGRLFNMDVVIFRWIMTSKIKTKIVVTRCIC